jgi:hypothetical protein
METPAPVKASFKIIVKSLDDNKMEFDLPRGTNFQSIKQHINQLTSIPIERIRLIYKAKVITDESLIENIVSEDNEVIHLIAKTSGTAAGPTPGQQRPANPPAPQPQRPHAMPINLSGAHFIQPIHFPIGGQAPGGHGPQMHTHIRTMPINPQGGVPMPNLFQGLFNNQGMNQPQAQPPSQPTGPNPDIPLARNPSQSEENDVPLSPSTPIGQQPALMPHGRNLLEGMLGDLQSIFNNVGAMGFGVTPPGPLSPPMNNAAPVQPSTNSAQQSQGPFVQFGQTQILTDPSGQPNFQAPPQGAQPPAPNPTFVNANQGATQVSSVNSQGITIAIPTTRGPRQQLLNTQILRENEALLRESSQIDFDIPRRIEPNNSATMLGNYLNTVHDHLQRFLPNLKRCSKILRSEQRLRNPEDRQNATRLLRNLGKSFRFLQKAFNECAFLENFEFKNGVGQFELRTEPENPSAPIRIPNTTIPDPDEELHIQEQRRQLHNMTNILAGGVPANMPLNQITRMANNGNEDRDLISIVLGAMGIADNIEVVMHNSLEPLDRNFERIKQDFQNILIDCQTRDDLAKAAIFKNETAEIAKTFTKYGRDMIYEGFDPEPVLQEIVDEYYPKFKTAFLDTYGQGRSFSETFKELLVSYYSKIAYELSEGLTDGISSFHYLFKKGITEYGRRVIGMEVPGFEMVFEDKIWRHMFEGYKVHKRAAEQQKLAAGLLSKLRAEKDDHGTDAEEQKPLSDSYLKGRFLT